MAQVRGRPAPVADLRGGGEGRVVPRADPPARPRGPGGARAAAEARGGGYLGARRRLRSRGGVGTWPPAETSQRAHGDPDEVSVGDYHLHDIVGWALTGGPVDDDGMLELLEPWRGHRQRVVRIILASGFRKPRFGPKMTIQDHRSH